MASQTFEKSKAGHPLVPKDVYQRRHGLEDYIHLELRDPITQIAHFLEEIGFEKTLLALKSEASENDVQINLELYRSNIAGLAEHSRSSLMEMWNGIVLEGGDGGIYPRPRLLAFAEEDGPSFGGVVAVDTEEVEKDSDGSDDSDSSTDSPAKAGQKRKRIMTPSSSDGSSSGSDSDSDSDSGDEKIKDGASDSSSSDSASDSDSSSDDERPMTKRTKLSHPADDEPKVTATSDSEDDEAPLQKRSKNKAAKKPVKDKNSSSSDSDSDSSSDSSSDSGRSAKRKSSSGSSSSSSSGSSSSSSSGSDSDSDSGSSSSSSSSGSSSSSSDSDSDSSSSSSSPAPKKSKKLKKTKLAKADSKRSGSTSSSATLVGDNDVKVKKTTDTLLVPDSTSNIGTKAVPATKENVKQLKKDHIPFSRIPTGQKIDPKFSSNEYISYDYADRAYQDLSVTKGKGFTKEKNKKKRGAYRGGAIDLTPKGIKFED